MPNPQLARLGIIKYTPRSIHQYMGQTSHATMAHMAQIHEQWQLRADPRFPLMQLLKRRKRYKAIFSGRPYKEMFT